MPEPTYTIHAIKCRQFWLGEVRTPTGAILHQTTISPTQAQAKRKATRWRDCFVESGSYEVAAELARRFYGGKADA